MVSIKIIQDCINNKPQAQRLLYEKAAPYLYAIIKNYIHDKEMRKDALQNAFAQIFMSLHRFDESRGNFKSWIAKITVNKTIDLLKKESKLKQFYSLEVVKEIPENVFDHLDSLSKKDIEDLLVKMPMGYRTVFLLSVIDGYNHKEISEMLGIKPETSRSQLLRSIKWIKKNINLKSNLFSYEAL